MEWSGQASTYRGCGRGLRRWRGRSSRSSRLGLLWRRGRHVDAVLAADRSAPVGTLGDAQVSSQVLSLAVSADSDAGVLAELLALLGGLRLAGLCLALSCFGRWSGRGFTCWLGGGCFTRLLGGALLLLLSGLALLGGTFLLSSTLGWLSSRGSYCRTTGSWGGGGFTSFGTLSSLLGGALLLLLLCGPSGLRGLALGGFTCLSSFSGLGCFSGLGGLSLASSLSSLSCLTLALAPASSTSLVPGGCLGAGDEV